jgi:glycosyltransferase involved in cell wall biosynthesis
LFYPAQFWPHKNHVTLLRAVKVLRDRHSLNFHVVLTGSDQGNLSYVKQLVSQLGLVDQVHFLGFVSTDELIALYQNAFALMYTSMFGPDNLPPLEAFALGCPVIAAKVPGSEEQLGKGAVLIEPIDEDAFADAVYELYKEPGLRESLIERGRAHVMSFTGEDYARGVFAILDEFEKVRRCWSQEERHEIRFPWRRFLSG